MTALLPSKRDEARARLRAYFEKTTDIVRGGQATFASKACACSMEHINIVLDGEDLRVSPDDYSVHVMPTFGTGWSKGMAYILVAFNDATEESVLASDAWRLELLPRFAEAVHTPEADRKRLKLINAWLNRHGFDAYILGNSCAGLYCHFEQRFIGEGDREPDLLPGALGISAEELIAFLHTLIDP